jgi:hypothetical protein
MNINMNTKKKVIITLALLTALVGLAWGGTLIAQKGVEFVKARKDTAIAESKKACAVDINAIVLADPEATLKTDRQIVEAVFNHYFDAYKAIPECDAAGIIAHRLAEIGTVKNDNGHILADITFELQPISMEKTEWATPETRKDGVWIKEKKGTLSIQKSKDSYYLVL